tara:strand:+ start:77389 stop:78213 length:825 start_codon:yes stop_codon:yes gene_type:complete
VRSIEVSVFLRVFVALVIAFSLGCKEKKDKSEVSTSERTRVSTDSGDGVSSKKPDVDLNSNSLPSGSSTNQVSNDPQVKSNAFTGLKFEYSAMTEDGKKRFKKEALEWTLDASVDFISSSKNPDKSAKAICIQFNDSEKAKHWFEMVNGSHEDSPNAYSKDVDNIGLVNSCSDSPIKYEFDEDVVLVFDVVSMSEAGKLRFKGEVSEWIRDYSVDYVTGHKSASRDLPSVCIKFNDAQKAKYWYEMVNSSHEDSPNSYPEDSKSIFIDSYCPEG